MDVTRPNISLKNTKNINNLNNTEYKCSSCNKKFSSKKGWNKHENKCNKNDDYIFQCIICGKQFSNKFNLKKHLKKCTNIQRVTYYNLFVYKKMII